MTVVGGPYAPWYIAVTTWWHTDAQDDKVIMKERYLGLHSPGDDGVPSDVIASLSTLIDTHLDLDAIVQVCPQLQLTVSTC